jgi:hypothetical protein
MGVITAPVAGSAGCPAWMAVVSKCGFSGMAFRSLEVRMGNKRNCIRIREVGNRRLTGNNRRLTGRIERPEVTPSCLPHFEIHKMGEEKTQIDCLPLSLLPG